MNDNKQSIIILLALTLNFVSYRCIAQDTASKKQNPELVSSYLKENTFPKPIGFVNDFEDVLTVEQEKKLTELITRYEQKTTNEIVIVTINSIEPYFDFNQYAVDLFNYWGVGKKDKNNGLVFLFSKSLKKIRISTGIGTEKILTDNFCKSIIDQLIIPQFKEDKYYDGILFGLAELIAQWK